ncbi:hypothetical protein [Microbacterium sp. 5K110]|jgi:hypothetical protein|uniref:hypothetical protein n=1 Tax=unclassified Microbacterium TaxID=2609290 RepID=UPI0010FD948D|nr:hypothetical protein [Microbacterium sp. 5K110]TLF29989.1 hypothetical protein FE256_11845 [Microbacterium sp. 5K110]
MRSTRPALAALPVLLVPALLALAGCTSGAPEPVASGTSSSPTPSSSTPSLSPSAPTPGGSLPDDASSLEQWAARALPENGLGGSTAVARGTGGVGPTGASVDLDPVGGSWDVVVACESATGAPLVVEIGGAAGLTTDVPCGAPGQAGAAPTTIRWDAAEAATLRVDSPVEAVFAYEVHPRAGT